MKFDIKKMFAFLDVLFAVAVIILSAFWLVGSLMFDSMIGWGQTQIIHGQVIKPHPVLDLITALVLISGIGMIMKKTWGFVMFVIWLLYVGVNIGLGKWGFGGYIYVQVICCTFCGALTMYLLWRCREIYKAKQLKNNI